MAVRLTSVLKRLELPPNLVATLVLVATENRPGSPRAASRAARIRHCRSSASGRRSWSPTASPIATSRRRCRSLSARQARWHSPLSEPPRQRASSPRATGRVAAAPEDRAHRDRPGRLGGPSPCSGSRAWPKELAAWRRTPTTSTRLVASRWSTLRSVSDGTRRDPREHGGSSGQTDPPASKCPSTRCRATSGRDAADVPPEPWAPVVAHDGIFRLSLITCSACRSNGSGRSRSPSRPSPS